MPESHIFRIDVKSSLDYRPNIVLAELQSLAGERNLAVQISDFYFLVGKFSDNDLDEIGSRLVRDPLSDQFEWRKIQPDEISESESSPRVVEVLFRPGTNDQSVHQLFENTAEGSAGAMMLASFGTRYQFSGESLSDRELHEIASRLLVNENVARFELGEIRPTLDVPEAESPMAETYPLDALSARALQDLSETLELDLSVEEMEILQVFYRQIGQPASLLELKTIAMMWGNAISQKSFKAQIRVIGRPTIDSLFAAYPQMATRRINPSWVRSPFDPHNNSIEFDYDLDLSFRLRLQTDGLEERGTAAANPFLGDLTRGVLSSGHKPIAVTDVLTLASPTPSQHTTSFVSGIGAYANTVGLPTVNGAVFYQGAFAANPAAFLGCVGIGLRSNQVRMPEPGDRVMLIGCRTEPNGKTDPLGDRKLIEVVERARKIRLINAFAACESSGFAAGLAHLARRIGAQIEMDRLSFLMMEGEFSETWFSHLPGRMLLAVPIENVLTLSDLCNKFDLELTDCGEFGTEGSPRLLVTQGERQWMDLSFSLIDLLPPQEFVADLPVKQSGPLAPLADELEHPGVDLLPELLLGLMAHPNIANKTGLVGHFDLEVGGSSVVRSIVGKKGTGHSDSAVIKPLECDGWRGFTVANGINPLIGTVDDFAMVLYVVDEAVRNAVATGANPQRIALVAQTYWGDPNSPEQMGRLVEAARGSYEAAVHLGTPFLDSQLHTFENGKRKNEDGIGRVVIGSIGIHPDVRKAVTMDLKSTGSSLYLIGEWTPFLGGSHVLEIFPDMSIGRSFPPPRSLPSTTPSVYQAYHQAVLAGKISAAHDISEGGLAVAAAEMALAGGLGLELDLSTLHESPFVALFAETPGCLLVEVASEDCDAFEMLFAKLPFRRIGIVDVPGSLSISHGGATALKMSMKALSDAYRGKE